MWEQERACAASDRGEVSFGLGANMVISEFSGGEEYPPCAMAGRDFPLAAVLTLPCDR